MTSVAEQLIIDTAYWYPIYKRRWEKQQAMDRGDFYQPEIYDVISIDEVNDLIEQGKLTPARRND